MFLTAQLVITIFLLAAEKHKGTFLAPVGIGLSLFIAELSGVYFTGGMSAPMHGRYDNNGVNQADKHRLAESREILWTMRRLAYLSRIPLDILAWPGAGFFDCGIILSPDQDA